MNFPLDDPRAYRRALGQFATGVTVVTANTASGPVGNTVNSFTSVSLSPPLILWSLSKTSRSFRAFNQGGSFAVNVLAAGQISVSENFSSAEVDKFRSVPWSPGLNGSPVIDGVIAAFECDTYSIQDCGDHIVLVGRVTRYIHAEGNPLLYAQGCYGTSTLHPALDRDAPAGTRSEANVGDASLGMLLFYAYHALYNGFEAHRRAEGLTAPQARVLTALDGGAQKDAEAIARDAFLPYEDARDAVSELVVKGLLAQSRDGTFALSELGEAARRRLHARLQSFEALHTATCEPRELQAARGVLASLSGTVETDGRAPALREQVRA